jgi:integrase
MFKLRFTLNGGKGFSGNLALEISANGKRAYILVKGLRNPNYKSWDKKNQCFIGLDDETRYNNNMINSLLNTFKNNILAIGVFDTPTDVVKAYKVGLTLECKREVSFAELLKQIVIDERNKKTTRSANYQLYNNLLNKLTSTNAPTYKGEKIANCIVEQIDNAVFSAFGCWVLKECNGKGYKNLMVTFQAAVNRASERYHHNVNKLDYAWRKLQPKKTVTGLTALQQIAATASQIPTLSAKEIERFAAFDLSTIAPKQQRNAFLLELYRDFALLMYYTMARPVDVIKWDYTHNYNPSTQQIVYVPHKLRNRGGKRVIINLNDKAIAIIEKYKNMSKGGYLLPLPINETAWGDDIDGSTFDSWEIKRNATLLHTNANLKKIAKALKLSVEDLTLYTFRHSAITHAVNAKGANIFLIARNAGTSVKMIEKHYYNDVISVH